MKDLIFDISSQLNVKEEVMNIVNDGEIVLKKSRKTTKQNTINMNKPDNNIPSKKISGEIIVVNKGQDIKFKDSFHRPPSNLNRSIKKFTNPQLSFPDNFTPSVLLIFHDSITMIVCDIMIFLIVIYTIIVTPIYLCFYPYSFPFKLLECFIELIFLFDMIMNFFTTFYDKEENLVLKLNLIAERYLSSWFLYDLVSSFPIEYISFFINIDSRITNADYTISYEVFKWIKVLQVSKIFRDNSLGRLIGNIVLNENYRLNRIIKFGFLFFFLSHISSCFFIYLGNSSTSQNNWITRNEVGSNKFDIYITSLYYNLVTIYSIGYGDITPVNLLEKTWVMILMIVGSILYSYAVSSISTIFLEKNIKCVEFERKLTVLESIDSEYVVPCTLMEKITKTIKFQYNKNENERFQFLESLPGKLKNDLMIIMYKEMIAQQSFFKKQPNDFLLYVLPMLRFHRVEQGEVLISVGDMVGEMYFVIKGSLSLTLGIHSNNLQLWKVRKGNHFGDLLMQLNENSPFELKCKKKYTDVLVLKKEDFIKIKNSFTSNIYDILDTSLNELKFVDKKFQLFHILSNHYKDPKIVKKKMTQLIRYLFEKGLDDYLEEEIDFEEPIDFIKTHGIEKVKELLDSTDHPSINCFKNKDEHKKRMIIFGSEDNSKNMIEEKNKIFNDKALEVQYLQERMSSPNVYFKHEINKKKKKKSRKKNHEIRNSKKKISIRESFKSVLFEISKSQDTSINTLKLVKENELKLKTSNLFEIEETSRKSEASNTLKPNILSNHKKATYEENSIYKSKTFNRKNIISRKNFLNTLNMPQILLIEKTANIHILSKINKSRLIKEGIQNILEKNKSYSQNEHERNMEILDHIDKLKDNFIVKKTENFIKNKENFKKFEVKEGERYISEVINRFEIQTQNDIIDKLENILFKIEKYNL